MNRKQKKSVDNIDRKNDWNWLDKTIAKMRYSKIDRYIPNGGIVLDIGCGREGDFLYRHKSKIKAGIGVDLRQYNHEDGNLQFFCNLNMEKLPIDDNYCDIIFMIAVLEHLSEPHKIIEECSRILKERGRIIITTPTPRAKRVLEFLAFKLNIISQEEIKEHVHYWNKFDIESFFSQYGFIVESYNRFWLGMNSRCVCSKNGNCCGQAFL